MRKFLLKTIEFSDTIRFGDPILYSKSKYRSIPIMTLEEFKEAKQKLMEMEKIIEIDRIVES